MHAAPDTSTFWHSPVMTRPALSALMLVLTSCELAPSAVEFDGLPVGPGPHLLLDDHYIESSPGVRRVVDSPVRDPQIPNPLVTGAEDGNFTPYFTVLRDAPDRFRLWYNVPYDDLGTDQSRLGYMESRDGIHWRRPRRILPDIPGGIRFGASVIRRPDGEGYLLGYYQSGGFKVARSEDGLVWVPVAPETLIEHNHDIAGLTYDPIRKHFVAVVSSMRKRIAGGISHVDSRQTQLSVSRDLIHWEDPWDVLVPDGLDPLDTQFYGLDAFLRRGDLLLGLVKVLREDLDADGRAASPRGVGWTSLAWSRDGRNWTRDRAIYFGPNPEPGSWDHAFAWIDDQVLVGDSLYLYYGGYQTGHRGDRSTERQIGLVVVGRDRYVGWNAGPAGGILLTRALRLTGSGLALNVDAAGGEAVVRLLSPEDRRELGRCEAVTGDHLAARLQCTPEIGTLREPIRLEIALRDATLYAFEILE